MERTNKGLIIFNRALILLVIVAFSSLFISVLEFFSFLGYLVILIIGGLGVLANFRRINSNSTIYLIISILIGASLNQILFIILDFLKINTIYSLVILTIGGLSLITLSSNSTKRRLSNFRIHQEKHFWILIILMLLCIFLVSDGVVYTNNGIYFHDTIHPSAELTKSQSLGSGFPVQDPSYLGKEIKWHFGYSILFYQLISQFEISKLPLIHSIMPSFLLILMFLLLYNIPREIFKSKAKVFLCILIVFSTLSLSLTKIILIINNLFGSSIIDPLVEPHFLFLHIVFMGSSGLAILIITTLFIIMATRRNYFIEMILLTGLAITKSTYFIPLGGAYLLLYFINFIRKRSIRPLIKGVVLVLPACLYIIFFILNAYQQNLWIIFPGYLSIQATNFNLSKSIINASLSFFITTLTHIGIGFIFIFAKLRKIISKGFWIKQLNDNSPILFFSLVILVSYSMGIFLIEVTELNHEQFLFPGYIILSLLTYNYLFDNFINKKNKRKIIATLLVILLFINSLTFLSFTHIIPSMTELSEDEEYTSNSFFAKLKLISINQIKKNLPVITFNPSCFLSYDFLNGIEKLSKEPDGVFVFNILNHGCENNNNKESWKRRSHFLRTALSGKQAIIEEYKYHGIIAQEDYCNRAFDNMLFFGEITGNLNEVKKIDPIFFLQKPVKYSDLSYYSYFRLFSEKNYYTYNEEIFNCLSNKFKEVEQKNIGIEFLREYIVKNKIKYIVFERREEPLKKYIRELKLKEVYLSPQVKIFKVSPLLASPFLSGSPYNFPKGS